MPVSKVCAGDEQGPHDVQAGEVLASETFSANVGVDGSSCLSPGSAIHGIPSAVAESLCATQRVAELPDALFGDSHLREYFSPLVQQWDLRLRSLDGQNGRKDGGRNGCIGRPAFGALTSLQKSWHINHLELCAFFLPYIQGITFSSVCAT